jgi:hypothetical protein
VFIACGEIPPEIVQQIQTAKAAEKMVEFSSVRFIAVDRWLKGGSSVRRAPARRTESNGRLSWQEDRDKASGKRSRYSVNVLNLHGLGDRDMRVIKSDNRLWTAPAASH